MSQKRKIDDSEESSTKKVKAKEPSETLAEDILGLLIHASLPDLAKELLKLELNDDGLKAFINSCFAKALEDPNLCSLIVQLCLYIHEEEREDIASAASFGFYLIDKVFSEFQDIVEAAAQFQSGTNQRRADLLLHERTRMCATMTFIGELYKWHFIFFLRIKDCIDSLTQHLQDDESMVECLCILMKIIGEKVDDVRKGNELIITGGLAGTVVRLCNFCRNHQLSVPMKGHKNCIYNNDIHLEFCPSCDLERCRRDLKYWFASVHHNLASAKSAASSRLQCMIDDILELRENAFLRMQDLIGLRDRDETWNIEHPKRQAFNVLMEIPPFQIAVVDCPDLFIEQNKWQLKQGHLRTMSRFQRRMHDVKHSPETSWFSSRLYFPEVINCLSASNAKDGQSDFTIDCRGKIFNCHQFILAQNSPTFEGMFNSYFSESQNRTVEADDISEEIMTETLRFIYCGYVETDLTHAAVDVQHEFLYAAAKYGLQGLVDHIMVAIYENLDELTACRYLLFADRFDLAELKAACFKIMAKRANRTIVASSAEWNEISGNKILMTQLYLSC